MRTLPLSLCLCALHAPSLSLISIHACESVFYRVAPTEHWEAKIQEFPKGFELLCFKLGLLCRSTKQMIVQALAQQNNVNPFRLAARDHQNHYHCNLRHCHVHNIMMSICLFAFSTQVVSEGVYALKISGNERLLRGITRETRKFSKIIVFQNHLS